MSTLIKYSCFSNNTIKIYGDVLEDKMDAFGKSPKIEILNPVLKSAPDLKSNLLLFLDN